MRRRVEIGILTFDPDEEAGDFRVASQGRNFRAEPMQLAIGKAGVKRTMTDRMDRDLFPPSAAFRNRVVPFDLLPDRSGAEPANRVFSLGHAAL